MHSQSHPVKIILASSSPYRKMLLERLGLRFDVKTPDIDESACPDERVADLVTRLARQKARAVAEQHPDALVIGSDQVAECDGTIAGKPGTEDKAIAQLSRFSGRTVNFHTAVAVVGPAYLYERTVVTEVKFRALQEQEIQRYVQADMPIDCAGSFKSEALGISLLEQMCSHDPTAIVGLPLIAVAEGLRGAGIDLP